MVDAHGKTVNSFAGNRLNPHHNWRQPLYSCVSAVRASIKTVQLRVNGTATLSNLVVDSVEPSNVTTPIWGVENTHRIIWQLDPLWGLISAEEASLPGVSPLRRSHLYLPASQSSVAGLGGSTGVNDAIAGASAHSVVFDTLYGYVNRDPERGGSMAIPDYTGATTWSLFTKWARLSRDTDTAGQISNLIWTDMMANAVVGTKSRLSNSRGLHYSRPAAQYFQAVAYDWRYASLALAFAAVYVMLLVWTILLYVTRACKFSMLRFFLDQTAAGRTMTTERFGAGVDEDLGSTNAWASVRGDEVVFVSKDHALDGKASVQGYEALRAKSVA